MILESGESCKSRLKTTGMSRQFQFVLLLLLIPVQSVVQTVIVYPVRVLWLRPPQPQLNRHAR